MNIHDLAECLTTLKRRPHWAEHRCALRLDKPNDTVCVFLVEPHGEEIGDVWKNYRTKDPSQAYHAVAYLGLEVDKAFDQEAQNFKGHSATEVMNQLLDYLETQP